MSNPGDYPYETRLGIRFPQLELVDVPALIAACTHKWYNETLCKVNDSVVRLGSCRASTTGTNDNDDEFFCVWKVDFD